MFGFDNIGKKIQIVAKVFFVLESIGSFICAVLLIYFFNIISLRMGLGVFPFFVGGIAGVVVFFIGMLFAWLSNMCLYGFGHLIQDTEEIKNNTAETNNILIEISSQETEPEPEPRQKPSISAEEFSKRVRKLQEYFREGQITREMYDKEYNRLRSLL